MNPRAGTLGIMRKRSGHRPKDTRGLIRAITDAGGTVTTTSRGHLRITGPHGVIVVGRVQQGRGRGRANIRAELRRAGLPVA